MTWWDKDWAVGTPRQKWYLEESGWDFQTSAHRHGGGSIMLQSGNRSNLQILQNHLKPTTGRLNLDTVGPKRTMISKTHQNLFPDWINQADLKILEWSYQSLDPIRACRLWLKAGSVKLISLAGPWRAQVTCERNIPINTNSFLKIIDVFCCNDAEIFKIHKWFWYLCSWWVDRNLWLFICHPTRHVSVLLKFDCR